jgi:ABC-type nitrate/sulfonate/bicarbonate transport system substrate-binding protein
MSYRIAFKALIWLASFALPTPAYANPYLARPGEPITTVYVATCAVSGGFIQLYTAIDNNIFDKYGIAIKHVVIRGGTNINLAALGTDEVQFLYCAADSTLPGMAAGRDATLIASPLVGLPYGVIARKEIRSVQDLKGKSIGVGSVAGLPYRLLRVFVKKFGLSDTQIRPVGGSQPERYNAMMQGVIDAGPFTPPMDARGKKDGFNLIYHMNDLGLPAITARAPAAGSALRRGSGRSGQIRRGQSGKGQSIGRKNTAHQGRRRAPGIL